MSTCENENKITSRSAAPDQASKQRYKTFDFLEGNIKNLI